MDPISGLYNRQYLLAMNAYMEKKGYPNGIGIYFGAPHSHGKLVGILDQTKPNDAEIFSIGEDEYLMMAGLQSEGEGETYEAFTKRLLEMDWTNG